MANATAFPEPWGYGKIIGENKTDLIGAAVDAWKNAGESNIPQELTFAFIPFIFLAVTYIRTQKIMPSLLVAIVSTIGLHVFELFSPVFAWAMYIIFFVGMGIAFAYSSSYNRR